MASYNSSRKLIQKVIMKHIWESKENSQYNHEEELVLGNGPTQNHLLMPTITKAKTGALTLSLGRQLYLFGSWQRMQLSYDFHVSILLSKLESVAFFIVTNDAAKQIFFCAYESDVQPPNPLSNINNY